MNALFYIFSSLALVSSIMVIQALNPVHSVLFLILVFFNSAAVLLLLGLDFFALIFLVVYVGAIAVLFLFVIMMLSIKDAEINEKRLRYLPIGAVLAFGFALEIFLVVNNDFIPLDTLYPTAIFKALQQDENLLQGQSVLSQHLQIGDKDSFGYDIIRSQNLYVLGGLANQWTEWSGLPSTWSNIETIGLYIYTYYFFFFLLASIILLVAMIGAIVLTMSKGVDRQRQKVFQQNTREFAGTVSRFA